MSSRSVRSFLDDAMRWCRTGAQTDLLAMIRSPHSGVPHDVGAAYATLATRTGPLLEAIEGQRLGLPPPDRDAAMAFAAGARRILAFSESADDERLREAIVATFGLGPARD
ncbi:MAG: hypothetical protein JOZ01_09120, partial [Candidatus Eremiobacteraeota bacterium]|nr:hypothetical protein [Candidatus Eremiobacteraeota bacterium]